MKQEIFRSKLLVISVIFLFILLMSSDVLPQRNVSAQSDVEKLIQEGKELYKNGEYKEAILKFLVAKDLAQTRKEISEIHFNLSLAYYANNQSIEASEHLQKLLEIQPERTINTLDYHPRFVELFNLLKSEAAKLKKKPEEPVVKAKPPAERKVKKGGGGFLLVIGALVVVGGSVAAALLLSKKESPTTGSIQVNSTPTEAQVFLDGTDTGLTTDCTLTDVSSGSHTVRLVKEGYENYEESVSITAGQTATVSTTLTPPTITVIEIPPGTVWTNGKEIEIQWETSGSGGVSTGAGLDPLIQHGRNVLDPFQRRAFQEGHSQDSDARERGELENSGTTEKSVILSGKQSKLQGISKKLSSSARAGDIFHRRAKDIRDIRSMSRAGITNIPVAPQISKNKFTPSGDIRVLALSYVKIDLYKGSTFNQTIVSSTANDGSYMWTVDSSLSDGADYKVRISSTGDSSVYGESDAFTIEEKSITVTEPTSDTDWIKGFQTDITWDYVGTIENVKIELYKGNDPDPVKEIVSSTACADNSYTWGNVDSTLVDGTDYKVRVSSIDDSSIYDDSLNFKIQEPALNAPSNLNVAAVSSSQIDLSWTDNSSNESGFKIERKTGASGDWSEIDTVNAEVTTYQDTGLVAETTYYYKVRGYNADGNSGYSNEVSASTSETLPAVPSNLDATAVSSSQIDLSWTDNSNNESGFKIERKTGVSGSWAEIDTVNADVTTYQDTGLEAETTYYYRVRAYNAVGNSDYSNETSATTTTIGEIEWVQVPAGSFEMGDNFNEGESDERPVHTVYLDTYSISKYEVTFEQYDAFCDATGRTKPSDEGWGRGDRPVINVDWADAKAFCDWLSAKTGENIHLPTEAQWEKAARGIDQRRYPWGDGSPDSSLANYDNNVGKTMPVGSYPAGVSPYGIHDMAGNVWEWCSDWYDANYYSSSPTNNPQGPSSGSYRVLRGGCWYYGAYYIRSAFRGYTDPSVVGGYNVGVRLCKDVPVAESITVTEPTSSAVWTKGQSADINWTSTGAINAVKLDLYKGGTFNQTIVLSTVNNNSYTWSEVDTSLVDGTDYKIRISSTDYSSIYGESSNFEIQEIAPVAPSNLNATAVSSSQIDLTWTDNSNNESGFKIERKTGASGTWAEIATVNTDVTTYLDSELEAETMYYYRVRAYNAAGDSDYSNESSATTTTIGEIEWVQVPAGNFKMGDNFNEGGTDELPVHTVYLDTYYISKYEVTFEQYDAFCDATARTKPSDEGWGRGDRPVINVDGDDAKAFCDWLSGETGENIHLPTEAQWEKAARGTDQRRYPWGDGSPDSSLANYANNVEKTMPVGSYPSGVSPYGIHDMAGNVYELCSDYYYDNYYSISPTNNPQGPEYGTSRVKRGGGWRFSASLIRSSYRDYWASSLSRYDIGFRLCKD